MRPHTKLATANVSKGLAFLLLAALAPAAVAASQAPKASASAAQAAHHSKPRAAKKPEPTPAPVVAEAPAPPNWPVNDPPSQPAVTWDAQGLSIKAANSSLRQIMDQVVTATGSKLEGLNKDERVFGVYGPGPAKDVLSQLLHGTGYNVLMLGDVGQGAPREIVLSARNTNALANNRAPQPNRPQQDEEDEPEEQPQQQVIQPQMIPQQPNPGGPPPGPLRTPEERMQEMQRQQQEMQRQQLQQMQQMQQQNQNQPPH